MSPQPLAAPDGLVVLAMAGSQSEAGAHIGALARCLLPLPQGSGQAAAGRVSVPPRANPVWLDPFCRNLELAAQAEHEDDLPENLSEIADLWNSPTRTHVSRGRQVAVRDGPRS